jgi:hypothetical protein
MIARKGRPFLSALLFLLLTMSLPAAGAVGEEAKLRPVLGGIEGDYIVVLQKDTPVDLIPSLARELAAKHGATVVTVWTRALEGFWATMPADAVRAMSEDPRVRYIDQNLEMRESGSQDTSNDARPLDRDEKTASGRYFNEDENDHPLWHLTRLSHRRRDDSQSADEYKYMTGGEGTTIYVVDTGVLRFHQEFVDPDPSPTPAGQRADVSLHDGRILELAGSNRVPGDPLPSSVPFDSCTLTDPAHPWSALGNHSHGTACASVAAGRNVGVAQEATIVPVKTFGCTGVFSVAYFISAFEWILERETCRCAPTDIPCQCRTPAVVTMSTFSAVDACRTWEGNLCVPGTLDQMAHVLAFEEAVERVINEGIPVVASANNTSRDACAETPARLSRSGGIRGWRPQVRGRVITVGGFAKDADERWISNDPVNPASNWGPCVDLWAPAERISTASTAEWDQYRPAGDASGTSFSAPMVAGLIARMFSDDPELKKALNDDSRRATVPDTIWQRLRESATPLTLQAIRPDDPSLAGLTGNDKLMAAMTLAASSRRLAYMGAFSFSKQPQPIALGTPNAQLTVEAVGTAATTYKWYEGASGETTEPARDASGMELTGKNLCVGATAGCVAPTANTQYWARATRVDEGMTMTADSAAATVVVDCPVITEHPASIWRQPHQSTTLSVDAVPLGVLYQWYRGSSPADSVAIPGATSACFEVVDPTETAGYWVRVSAAGCPNPVDSEVALVRVVPCEPPADLTVTRIDPPIGDVPVGRNFTLAATASGPGLAYLWFRVEGGVNVPVRERICDPITLQCAESGPLVRSDRLTTPTVGRYFARISSNACGFADSNVVEVRSCSNVGVSANSVTANQSVVPGGHRLLGVRAEAHNGASLTYQWYSHNLAENNEEPWAPIPGATSPVYRATPPPGLRYRVRVYDGSCSVSSNEMSVLVARDGCTSAVDRNLPLPQPSVEQGEEIPPVPFITSTVSGYEWWLGTSDVDTLRQVTNCPVGTTCTSARHAPRIPGNYFLRIFRDRSDCRSSFATAMEDYGPFFINVCPIDGIALWVDPSGITPGKPFKLHTTEYPGATYRWFEGFDSTTQIAQTSTNVLDFPDGITSLKRYWVSVTLPCRPNGARSVYLVLSPCGSPPRRAVAHPTAPVQTGGGALLSVEDDHDGTTFQWYQGSSYSDTSRPVGTGPSVQVNPAATTTYWVRMSKTCGSQTLVTDSDFVTVDVVCAVTLDRQPQPASAVMPASGSVEVSASVVASGNGPFTYQWFEGATPVPGATSDTFTWSYTATASSPALLQRTFTVSVTGACGSATSEPVTLSILRSPQRIYAYSPGGPIPEPGAAIQLFVEMDPQASAEHTYSYEWFRDNGTANGESIGGGKAIYATTWSLDTYWVKITGTHTAPIVWTEVTVSPKMHLSVYGECRMPPLRATQSAVSIGASSVNPEQVVLTAYCDGPGVQLQWYSGQSGDTRYPIASDLGKPHQLTVGGAGDLPRPYWVRASMDCGTVQDSPTLTFTKGGCNPILFAQHPQPVEVAYGEDAFVWADVANPAGKSYEWFEGESETFVGSGLPLELDDVIASRRVWVKVGDPQCGTSANSLATTVRVASCGSVSVPSWPGEAWVDKGARKSLSVNAIGATGFQWYKGELGDYRQPVDGATQSTYLTDPLDADARYWVRVFGNGCVVDSPTISVRVCDPPHWTSDFLTTTTSAVPGQGIWLAVGAAGTDTSYQWYQGSPGDRTHPVGRPIHAYYLIAQQTADYWVEVTGRCGAGGADQRLLASPKMTVSVCPTATEAPTAARSIVMSGATTQLSVAAQGSRLQYQWYSKVGTTTTAIPNSNSATITSPPITADTEIWAVVRSDVGGCARATPHLTVTVCREPTIRWTASTSSQNVASNQPVWLGVDVTSTSGAKVTFYAGPAGDVANSTAVSSSTINRAVQVMPAATTTYWAMADNGAGCTATTAGLTLTVCIPTFTTPPPATRAINAGQSTTLTVATDVTSTLQWYTGEPGDTNTPIAGATSASLTVSPTADTAYWVRATGCDSTDSTATLVTVCHPPAITQLTPSVWIGKGSSITLNVTATGTDPAFQWYQGNPGNISMPLAGAILPYVTVSPSNTTTYWVRVTTACGTTDSAAVVISVCAPPAIGTPPASQTLFSGTSASLSVAATESTTTPMTYQWYAGTAPSGTAISGATGTSYTTPALTAPASYWVKVTAGTCVTNSPTATIGICSLPATIAGAPNAQIAVGEVVRLQVPAISPTPSQFRWYQGASGNTSTLLTGWRTYGWLDVAPSAATTQYWAEAQYGSCISKTTTTTVSVCVPAFTTQPGSPLINSGQSATLTAAANTSGVTYQWYIGTSGVTASPISGATAASLTVAPAATTNYWVRATSFCGRTADSNTAMVTICQPASITAQPQGASIATGQSATTTVTAAGTNLTYQWYQGSSGVTTAPVAGATSASLTVSPSVPASYWVRVTSGCGSANSAAATVNVCATPNVSVPPASQTIFSGTSATLTVTASQPTGMPLSYQWYSGTSGSGTAISGATASSYTTPVLTAQANYWVRVTSGVCSANSATATVSMCSYPATLTGAADVQTTIGESVRLQVPVVSPVPDQYRWYQGPSGNTSTPLTGWRTYGWLDVAPSATTQYWAEVQKGSCISKTTTTTVSVCVPGITAQPASTTVVPNASATLSVAADMGVTYQWYRGTTGGGTPISGATASSCNTGPLTATTDYWVRVTSSCGRTADSATATVTVCTPPVITSQPTNTPPVYANNYTATGVSATGTNLTYQWYRGERGVTSTPVAGGTNAVLELYPAGTYKHWVRVTGMCGSVDSIAAWVSVYPTITTQPANVTIPSGSTTTLTVQASGNDLHYQWYSGSTPVGTDSASFTTPALTADTSYRVVVTSGIAPRSSATATVTICQGPNFQIWVNYYEGCSRTLGVTVVPNATYRWYKGEPGDTSQPVSSSYYFSTCVTETTKFWVRVSNGICYRESWVIVYP